MENILRRLDEQYLFSFYFPLPIKVKKNKYKSPFRFDRKSGSCHFAWYKNRFLFFDKSYNKAYDVFQYISHTENISFYEALHKVNIDFQLGLIHNPNLISNYIDEQNTKDSTERIKKLALTYNRPENEKSSNRKFKITTRDYNSQDLLFWSTFCITPRLLTKHKVKAVRQYSIDHGSNWRLVYSHTNEDPCYVYIIPSVDQKEPSVKLYRPYNKNFKWSSSTVNDNICHGYSSLDRKYDTLYITSSLKDVMCLNSLGLEAVCPTAESSYIDRNIIAELKLLYDKVIILYDSDPAGIKCTLKHSNLYDVDHLILPFMHDAKDPSDICAKYGRDVLRDNIIV